MPPRARDAFVSRAAELADKPWDGARVLPGDDAAYRQATFDGGMGLLHFRIDESAERLRSSTSPGYARSPELRSTGAPTASAVHMRAIERCALSQARHTLSP